MKDPLKGEMVLGWLGTAADAGDLAFDYCKAFRLGYTKDN
jgi:hypothetical protein